jgi:hypothetical protein
MSITVRQGRTRRWTATITDATNTALVNTYSGSETLTLSMWPVGTTNAVSLGSSSNAVWLNATAATATVTLFQDDTTNAAAGVYEAVVTVTTGGEVYDALPTLVTITPSRADTGWLVQPLEVTASWSGFADLDAAEQIQLIEAASDSIEQACERTFARATYTDTFDGDNQPRLWLRNRPVVSVTSVTVNNAAMNAADYTVDTRLGCVWYGAQGWAGAGRQRRPGWQTGVQNIVVTYTAGYSAIPAPIKRAAIVQCKYLSDSSRASSVYEFESLGDYQYKRSSQSDSKGLAPNVEQLIAPYILTEVI